MAESGLVRLIRQNPTFRAALAMQRFCSILRNRKIISIKQDIPANKALGWKKELCANFQVSCINLPYTAVKSPIKIKEKLTMNFIGNKKRPDTGGISRNRGNYSYRPIRPGLGKDGRSICITGFTTILAFECSQRILWICAIEER
jgi:hypothetical protein